MNYWIWLRRKDGRPFVHHDNFLPGLVPAHVVEMLTDRFAADLGLCGECSMASHCHVIDASGAKYCTVLFHDALRPAWRLESVA